MNKHPYLVFMGKDFGSNTFIVETSLHHFNRQFSMVWILFHNVELAAVKYMMSAMKCSIGNHWDNFSFFSSVGSNKGDFNHLINVNSEISIICLHSSPILCSWSPWPTPNLTPCTATITKSSNVSASAQSCAEAWLLRYTMLILKRILGKRVTSTLSLLSLNQSQSGAHPK